MLKIYLSRTVLAKIFMIFLEDKIWFSPLNVIHHFRELENKLSEKEKSSKGFRKAEEMYSVALMLVGIIKLQNREYWLQMVDDKARSPDVRTGTYRQIEGVKMPEFAIEDVEVVDFGEHSPEKSLTDFLKRTKLSNTKKSYDSLTTILCRVKSNIHLPSFNQMNQELKSTTFHGPVMILGRTSVDEEKSVYKIAQIHPTVDLITEFNVLDELLNKKYNGVLSLKRATTFSTEYRAEEKHFPFEKISFAD
jgi:hypothetical protein